MLILSHLLKLIRQSRQLFENSGPIQANQASEDQRFSQIGDCIGAYSLGKAQEVQAILSQAGIPALSHPTVAKMTAACRAAGCQLPKPLILDGNIPAGHALICPPNVMRSEEFKTMTGLRTAILSGWTLDKNAIYRFGVDAAFPLSDHADFPGLLETVRRVNPRRIITVHGYTKEFAAELRRQNYEAWAVDGGDQMEFDLQR